MQFRTPRLCVRVYKMMDVGLTLTASSISPVIPGVSRCTSASVTRLPDVCAFCLTRVFVGELMDGGTGAMQCGFAAFASEQEFLKTHRDPRKHD